MSIYNENTVNITGNLGETPVLRYTESGKAVCNLRVATNESWIGKDGERQERVEWHRVVVWGKTAITVCRYKQVGDCVSIKNGILRTREWESATGEKHYTTEIHTVKVEFGPRAARNLVPRETVADFYKEMATRH